MSESLSVHAHPSRRPSAHPRASRTHGDPCTLVIFGAAGDLARRKLLPAIYSLLRDGLLHEHFRVLGVGLEKHDDESYRALVRQALESSREISRFDEGAWNALCERLYYVSGNLAGEAVYAEAAARLALLESRASPEERNRLFYLAVPPSVFEPIIDHLHRSEIAVRIEDPEQRPWARVIVEKPFGVSLATAQALSHVLLGAFAEQQVYRIDHYVGKETVQNLLVFRAANPIFEALWNHRYVSHVQITAAETVGVEQRGAYYEEAGVVRDMFQNHLLQLLALTAMDLPTSMTADAVRDEKVRVLRSIVPFTPDALAAVRGQYIAGEIEGRLVQGYREEPRVSTESRTPTFAAIRFMVDNYRWQGVPFYVRSGKRMARRVSEIAIEFRPPPHLMFQPGIGETIQSNVLVIRVQPNEGISLRFEVKRPGAALALTPEIEVCSCEMDFSYAEAFGDGEHPAYQTLILDAMIGDATLFTRTDEVEAAWRVVDPIIEYWAAQPDAPLAFYRAGTWGPAEADELLARDGFRWRTP